MSLVSTLSNHPRLTCATLLIACTVFANIIRRSRRNPRRLPRPPGPKGYPIVGNLLDLPSFDDEPWLIYDKMKDIYGIIFDPMIRVLGQPILIIGSMDKVQDIFERRSNIYSSRAHIPMVMDLMGWDWNFAFLPYGPRWRKERRIFHDHFHQGVISKYNPVLSKQARVFLQLLLESPNDLTKHIRYTFSATMMYVAYGIDIEPYVDSSYVSTAEQALKSVSDATAPGKFLVDFIPIMKYIPKWLPGAGFQRQAEVWRRLKDDYVDLPYNHVRRMMKSGEAVPCMVTSILDSFHEYKDINKEDSKLAKNIPAIAFAGGADSTVATLQTFFLAMALYPEAQKKAQEELDRVVGTDRLPECSDKPVLPYVNAVIKEFMRWHTVANLGLAHSASEDDEYNGYFIPKGTIVMANTWAILHDPDVFEEPNAYKPERYLKEGQLNPDMRDPSVGAFGYGRRTCPGRYFGEQNIFILVASTLAAFDISAPKGDDGKPIKLEARFISSPLSFPAPFECQISPRRPNVLNLIEESPT